MALIWYDPASIYTYRERLDRAVSYYQQTRGCLPSAVLVRPDEIEDKDVTAVRGVPVIAREHSFELHFLLTNGRDPRPVVPPVESERPLF